MCQPLRYSFSTRSVTGMYLARPVVPLVMANMWMRVPGGNSAPVSPRATRSM